MASHPLYYVPEQSKWPIIASLGLLVTVVGLGTWFNDLKVARTGSAGPLIFFVGALLLAWMLFGWFGNVIRESRSGLYSGQMDRSFRWGMRWFIFSEVMFFAAFFGALFYLRVLVGPWKFGQSMALAPRGVIDPWHLPLLNTVLLVSSSFTLTFAHHALRHDKRGPLKAWLALTVLLGASFLVLQAEEYVHAYTELDLTLRSGVYGATFFMLTGFHGAHVTIGALMLLVMLIRILRGHFSPAQHFGFEAAGWYWHFVDAVWLGLFVFVYVL